MGTIYKQLVECQAEFKTLPKDKAGYGYKYTDYDTVVSSVRPILAKHGLGCIQPLMSENGKTQVKTVLFNSEGEQIVSVVDLPEVSMAKTNAAQNLGASITYMKRYALCSLLAISADEDVDGNIESAKMVKAAAPKATEEQKKRLKELMDNPLWTPAEKNNYRKCFVEGENPEILIKAIQAELEKRTSKKEGEKFELY